MNSEKIRELMAQVESGDTPRNLSPSEVDRAAMRSQKALTLAVLEVAFQLAVISEHDLENIVAALTHDDD